MIRIDLALWNAYCADSGFLNFLNTSREFDLVGFERTFQRDKRTNSFEFRQVIVEAYLEESRADQTSH